MISFFKKRLISKCYTWIFLLILVSLFVLSINRVISADDLTDSDRWPKFGLVYQKVKNIPNAAIRYDFYWGYQKNASQFNKVNPKGVYVPNYNLVRIVPLFSEHKYGPDYNYIATKHPDWLMRYKDGSLVTAGIGDFVGPRLDLGNSSYNDYAIEWVQNQAFGNKNPVKDLGFDNAMFMYANKRWVKYDTPERYRDAWEYFLKRLSEAFRPQHKIILNVGSCDLPTFARMIRHVDGVLYEDLCTPPHKPPFDPEKARQAIRDRWMKGQWCMENGKIWAVRYNSTVDALKLANTPKTANAYISVGDREIIVSTPKQKILGKVNLDAHEGKTLANLAKALDQIGLKVNILNPYAETSTVGTFQAVKYAKIGEGLTLKLKQAPREAFLFGYGAILMVAGPNSYFIIGDERHQEYYYPEMDWPVGSPRSPRQEVAPQVFHRAFQKLDAFINLSDSPFRLPNGKDLPPFRGALIKNSK